MLLFVLLMSLVLYSVYVFEFKRECDVIYGQKTADILQDIWHWQQNFLPCHRSTPSCVREKNDEESSFIPFLGYTKLDNQNVTP
jgi:hypothetical protein